MTGEVVTRGLVCFDGRQPLLNSGETAIQLGSFPSVTPAPTTVWNYVRFVLNDITSMSGTLSMFDNFGYTSRIEWHVGGSIPSNLLNTPQGLVDGRNVISSRRDQSKDRTIVEVTLGWRVPVGLLVRACLGQPNRIAISEKGRERILVDSSLARNWLGLDPLGHVWPKPGDSSLRDPDNPGPTPMADRYFGHQAVGPEIATHSVFVERSTDSWLSEFHQQQRREPWLFEPKLINPIGVKGSSLSGRADVVWDASTSRRRFFLGDREVASTGPGLEVQAMQKLRSLQSVKDSVFAHPSPYARARFILECAAAGIPLIIDDLDSRTAGLLPDSIVDLADARRGSDLSSREIRDGEIALGIRAAFNTLRQERATLAWQKELPSVSVVIATMRPDFLSHALEQVRSQVGVELECLIGMHGFQRSDVAPEILATAHSLRVDLIPFSADTIFGDVLNELSQRATGEYISKMDDDDWYGEYHLRDLIDGLEYSGATLVGSGVQYVYMNHSHLTIRRSWDEQYRFGGHPGGPTLTLLRQNLIDIGGWPRLRRAVDTGLNQRIVQAGGSIYQTASQNFLFNRRSAGHTWKASNEYFYKRARASWLGLVPPAGFEAERAKIISDSATITPSRLFGVETVEVPRWEPPELRRTKIILR